jgi:hypothetical protein
MKTMKIGTFLTVFLVFVVPLSHALDIESIESYQIHDRLLSYTEPGPPEIIDGVIIFTASSSLRRVGVAFADEGFAKVHWFRQLLVSRDPLEILSSGEKKPNPYKDSGIIFYVHQIPEGASEIEYRLVVNGLWIADPVNPHVRRDNSGISRSVIPLPKKEIIPNHDNGPPGRLNLAFKGPPGETVTVAGNFNGWDPFMYELKEGPAGNYTINIPLPPGKYQYVFFHKGQRFLDPYNANRIYAKDGKAASEIVIH